MIVNLGQQFKDWLDLVKKSVITIMATMKK